MKLSCYFAPKQRRHEVPLPNAFSCTNQSLIESAVSADAFLTDIHSHTLLVTFIIFIDTLKNSRTFQTLSKSFLKSIRQCQNFLPFFLQSASPSNLSVRLCCRVLSIIIINIYKPNPSSVDDEISNTFAKSRAMNMKSDTK